MKTRNVLMTVTFLSLFGASCVYAQSELDSLNIHPKQQARLDILVNKIRPVQTDTVETKTLDITELADFLDNEEDSIQLQPIAESKSTIIKPIDDGLLAPEKEEIRAEEKVIVELDIQEPVLFEKTLSDEELAPKKEELEIVEVTPQDIIETNQTEVEIESEAKINSFLADFSAKLDEDYKNSIASISDKEDELIENAKKQLAQFIAEAKPLTNSILAEKQEQIESDLAARIAAIQEDADSEFKKTETAIADKTLNPYQREIAELREEIKRNKEESTKEIAELKSSQKGELASIKKSYDTYICNNLGKGGTDLESVITKLNESVQASLAAMQTKTNEMFAQNQANFDMLLRGNYNNLNNGNYQINPAQNPMMAVEQMLHNFRMENLIGNMGYQRGSIDDILSNRLLNSTNGQINPAQAGGNVYNYYGTQGTGLLNGTHDFSSLAQENALLRQQMLGLTGLNQFGPLDSRAYLNPATLYLGNTYQMPQLNFRRVN